MASEYIENIAGFVLYVIFCLLVGNGILLNAFIVIVNLNRWKKPQPLQAIDIIITSLAIGRIILLFMLTLIIIDAMSGRPITKLIMYPEYSFTLLLSIDLCSLWFGLVLCVFYCVKITSYNNRLFMRLKMKISKMVPWLLLISLVLSFLSSLPFRWFVYSIQSFNYTDGQTGVLKISWLNSFIISFAGSITPFIIFCISLGLLILSLLRHTRNLDSLGSGFSDSRRDVHLSVIRNMISFLFFYVLHFLSGNLFSVKMLFETHPLLLLFSIFLVALPSLHSIFLIVSNRELKNAFRTVIHCLFIRAGVGS